VSRLALELGLRVPAGWVAGWLRAGAGNTAPLGLVGVVSPDIQDVEFWRLGWYGHRFQPDRGVAQVRQRRDTQVIDLGRIDRRD
jgi:hypothetical protein